MRRYLLLVLCVGMQTGSSGQDHTFGTNATELVAAAQEYFATVRSAVGRAIEEGLEGKAVGVKALDAILAVLNVESNKLHQGGFDTKLDLAARRVEAVRTQVVASLNDPANKAMAAGLDPQEWLDQIALQRSVGQILAGDLDRLACTLEELRRWAGLVEPVAPRDQVASGLKTRLAELLNEWRGLQTNPNQPPQKAVGPTTRRLDAVHLHDTPDKGNDPGGTTAASRSVTQVSRTGEGVPVFKLIRLSPPVATVLRLAETGAPEHQILTFIDAWPSAFALDADQIIYGHSKLSPLVICRMLQHDAALRAKTPADGSRRTIGSVNPRSTAVRGRPGNPQR